jgi:hypothetical protein
LAQIFQVKILTVTDSQVSQVDNTPGYLANSSQELVASVARQSFLIDDLTTIISYLVSALQGQSLAGGVVRYKLWLALLIRSTKQITVALLCSSFLEQFSCLAA